MTDITTVEEVQAEDYTVRVAQTDDGSAWEAVVLSKDGGRDTPPMPGMAGMVMFGNPGGSDDDGSDDAPIGPPVTAPHRWVAIGFAIEAYEWGEVDETTVEIPDAYDVAHIKSADLSIDDELDSQRVFPEDTDATFSGSMEVDLSDLPGPWDPEGDE